MLAPRREDFARAAAGRQQYAQSDEAHHAPRLLGDQLDQRGIERPQLRRREEGLHHPALAGADVDGVDLGETSGARKSQQRLQQDKALAALASRLDTIEPASHGSSINRGDSLIAEPGSEVEIVT